jgi:ubiquinone/menaquinone biosynthesis C-methylase UbiE
MPSCCLIVLSTLTLTIAVLCGLYGDQVKTVAVSLQALAAMNQGDFDAFINSYDVFDDPQHTKNDEAKVNAVYKVLVPLMALGDLTKFYIPPVMDESRVNFKSLNYQQVVFEKKMADTIKLGPGKQALDIGCGQGQIADTVQDHTGAKITGINISPEQLASARSTAESKGKLGKVLEFKQASMNDPLPYPDNHFDAVYIMQAVTYVHEPKKLMAEIRRVLKPGGMFSDLSIVTMDKYTETNSTHVRMLNHAKRVAVVPIFRPVQEYEEACTANGFSLKISKDLGHADMTKARPVRSSASRDCRASSLNSSDHEMFSLLLVRCTAHKTCILLVLCPGPCHQWSFSITG